LKEEEDLRRIENEKIGAYSGILINEINDWKKKDVYKSDYLVLPPLSID